MKLSSLILYLTIFAAAFIGSLTANADQLAEHISFAETAIDASDPEPESALADQLASQIIDYATTFLGRPYRAGGKGPSGFDCSGFTSYVFKNFDIKLSPSSRSQFSQGTAIPLADVRPGDLLFFSGRASGKTVGHVAMAVDVADDGTVTFIHAANRGGIRYDKYPDGGYYSRRYIGAKRVLQPQQAESTNQNQ